MVRVCFHKYCVLLSKLTRLNCFAQQNILHCKHEPVQRQQKSTQLSHTFHPTPFPLIMELLIVDNFLKPLCIRPSYHNNKGAAAMLEDMLAFAVVVEQSSMNKASVLLNLSQPALSRRIAKLEEELGVKLYRRLGK